MAQYIDKSALIEEIEKILLTHTKHYDELAKCEVWITAKEIEHRIQGLKEALSIINTLEVKEVDTWHLQEKEDIYNAVKDWGLHTFACIMKDGTIQRFTGMMDEDCEGHISIYVDGVNDDYDDVDDIVKWTELT